MTAATLVVNEVFGPTFQGEGPHTGQRAAFVRTGGCNLHCSWCDTPYTWDASRFDLRSEMQRVPVDRIVAQVVAMQPSIVVVSGGEPLLHQEQPGWHELLSALVLSEGIPVEVETNGTIAPNAVTRDLVEHFNVSPKLQHAGDPLHMRLVPEVLSIFAALAKHRKAVMKVVVQDEHDVRAAAQLADTYGWPKRHVYVMPEGTDADTLLARHRALSDVALSVGVNITTRLHVLTWGEERAR